LLPYSSHLSGRCFNFGNLHGRANSVAVLCCGNDTCFQSGMTSAEMKDWTFAIAVRAVAFTRALSRTIDVREPIVRQLLRSSTAIPGHYRAACRAQSRRDFINKMKRLEEEADESELWLALLRATGLPHSVEPECRALENECHQVVAIAVQSVKTARRRLVEERRVLRPK